MANQSSYFEDIMLPPVVLAGLYRQSLVTIEPATSAPKKQVDFPPSVEINMLIDAAPKEAVVVNEPDLEYSGGTTIASLGDFQSHVLVLVNDSGSLHLSEPEVELLGKMLQALKLSFADVAIVNTATQQVSWTRLQKQFPAKRIMLFGVEPANIEIPVRFPHFRVQTWANSFFLYSPSLAEINQPSPNQVQYKKELWKALLEMFAPQK